MSQQYTILDLETTGLTPEFGDKIIEVAVMSILIEGQQMSIKKTFESLINPEQPLEDHITMITGITNKDLEEAPTWNDILPQLTSYFHDTVIVGHNIVFDINFLNHNGYQFDLSHTIDTLHLASLFEPSGISLSLESLANRYNIEHKSHRAMGDVEATKQLFELYWQKLQHIEPPVSHVISFVLEKSHWMGKNLFPSPPPNRKNIAELLSRVYRARPQQKNPLPTHQQLNKDHLYSSDTTLLTLLQEQFERKEKAFIILPSFSTNVYSSLLACFRYAHTIGEKIIYVYQGTQPETEEAVDLINKDYPLSLLFFKDPNTIISTSRFSQWIVSQQSFSLDETVFAIKILLWIQHTTTGLIDELPLPFGQKLLLPRVTILPSSDHKQEIYYQTYQDRLAHARVLLMDYPHYFSLPDHRKYPYVLIENGTILEDQLIRYRTEILSANRFSSLLEAIEDIWQESQHMKIQDVQLLQELKNAVDFFWAFFGLLMKKSVEENGNEVVLDGKQSNRKEYLNAQQTTEKLLELLEKVKTLYTKDANAMYDEITKIQQILTYTISFDPDRLIYVQIGEDEEMTIKCLTKDIERFFQERTEHIRSIQIFSSPAIDVKKNLSLQEYRQIRYLPHTHSSTMLYLTKDYTVQPTASSLEEYRTILETIISKKKNRVIFICGNYKTIEQTVVPLSGFLKQQNITYVAQKLSGGEYKILEKYYAQNGTPLLFCTTDFFTRLSPTRLTAELFIVQKLPFAYTNGSVDMWRKSRYNNAFLDYALPKGLYRFDKILGIIEKTPSQNKKVLILDNKIITEKYGSSFTQMFPYPDNIHILSKREISDLC